MKAFKPTKPTAIHMSKPIEVHECERCGQRTAVAAELPLSGYEEMKSRAPKELVCRRCYDAAQGTGELDI